MTLQIQTYTTGTPLFLAAETDIVSRYELVFAQIANKEGSLALETLENMESILPENDIEMYNYYQMKDLLPEIVKLNCDEIDWGAIDQSLVIALSENNEDLPGALAKAIRMHYDESYTYAEPIYVNESIASKSTTASKISKSAAITDNQNLKVSPNPANDFLIAEYPFEKSVNEALLVITDMQGRLQMKHKLKTTTNQALIDVSSLKNGTYHCTIMIDGFQKSGTKIIVQH